MTDQTQDPASAASSSARQAAQDAASQTSLQGGTAGDQGHQGAASRPSWLPEAFWDATKGAAKDAEFASHLASLEKFKTDAEAKRSTVPEKPEGYEPDLGDIKLPAGQELNVKDPRFIALQKVAHEEGLTPETVNKLLRIEANQVVANDAAVAAGRAERDKMLGENGAARVDALAKWIDAQFPDEKEAQQVKATMWTPVIVQFFEKIQKALSTQGAHGFVQLGRDASSGTDGKPENWEKLSAVDRRTWFHQENRKKANPATQ